MDVSRRYYEEIDDFVRAIGRNAHRRRHLPFWNLALGALASSEASALQGMVSATSSSAVGNSLSQVSGGSAQSAIGDIGEPVGAFSRALTNSSGRVLYVTFHTSPTSHVAPIHAGGPFATDNGEDVLVASAILSNYLVVIFCADDTLDALVASWVYAEVLMAQRGKSQSTPTTPSTSQQTSKIQLSANNEKNAPRFLTSLPSSFKPLRYASRVSLYGSMAHVRALLDLANTAASDPKFATLSADNPPSFGLLNQPSNSNSRRFIPNDYRMSRDDSGMRVLGGRNAYRQSIRPQASEFAFGTNFFKRRTRNAYRMFFIATERLESIDKHNAEAATRALIGEESSTDSQASVPVHDTSKLILDAAKCLRLATSADWEELKAILRNENPDADGEEDNDFDATLESVQKGNVYLWEAPRRHEKSGKLSKPKIRCFAVLDFHTRPLPELSCVEIIDLHVSNPSRDTDAARMLTESLSRKFLTATLAAPAPYHFLFVKVDVSVTESSDRFLLDCGFVADSVADFVTLEACGNRNNRFGNSNQFGGGAKSSLLDAKFVLSDPSAPAFEITRVVKITPLTEKAFTAYEIKVVETGELVRKRYREFDKLYDQLKAQLPGSTIPKLPKKKLFGNMDSEFVEKRRAQLQNWLNEISRIPGVEESGWVSNFLWTELKIRGVKHISEAERFHRTLQKQAEEARLAALQSATASSAAQTPLSMAWPSTQQPPSPEVKPATIHTSPTSKGSHSSKSHSSSAAASSSASNTANNATTTAEPSSSASSSGGIVDPQKTQQQPKAGRRKDKKARRLSQ